MIMQGKTPRGLGWSGLLTMFGLSALLLPLSPTWAQKADGEERSESEVEVVVEESPDGSEGSELRALKRTLEEEIHRLRSLEKKIAEKATTATKPIKPIEPKDGPKKEQGELTQKAFDLKKNAIIELRASSIDDARTIKVHPKLFEAKELRFQFDPGQRGAIDRELARAKAEVERARAQLHRAESQLEKLGAELKAREAKAKELDRKSDDSPDEGHDRDKESANLRRKLEQDQYHVIVRNKKDELNKLEDAKRLLMDKERSLHPSEKDRRIADFETKLDDMKLNFIVRDKEQISKLDDAKRLLEKKLSLHSPEKDRRIADLEKKLDELINEVKNLKSERAESKK